MPPLAIAAVVGILGYVLYKSGALGAISVGTPSNVTGVPPGGLMYPPSQMPGSLGGQPGAQITGPPTGVDTGTQGQQFGQVAGVGAAGLGAGIAMTGGAAESSLAFLGAATIPVVGAAIAGITIGLGVIFKHHADAIKKEKGDILAGINKFYTLADETLAAYNAHQISRQTAITCLTQAIAQFVQVVAPVTKPSMSTTPVPFWGMLGKASGSASVRGVRLPAALPPFKTALPPNPDVRTIKGANGPFYVLYMWVLPVTGQLIRALAYWAPTNGFTYTNPAMPPGTDFPGVGAHTFVINSGGLA